MQTETAAAAPRGFIDEQLRGLGCEALLALPAPVIVSRMDNTVVLVNQPALDLFRAPLEQLRGGWRRLVAPADEAGLSWIGLPERAHGTERLLRRMRLGDGTLQLVEWMVRREHLGAEVYELAVASEATSQRGPTSTERGMRELVEDSPVILGRLDSLGRMMFVNRAIERYSGLSVEDVLADPLSFWARVPEDRRPSIQSAVVGAYNGTTTQVDVPIDLPAGGRTILQATFTPAAQEGGRITVVEVAATDVTALLDQAELRSQREARVALDRLQSHLLGAVSHELRSPLVSIKGYNELLLRGAFGPLSPAQRKRLEIAGVNIDRLVDLIETLLDFAHREEGRLELREAPLDLREVVREACAQLADRIQARGLPLRIDLPETALPVIGDRARLVQVLRALLSNAEKFSDANAGGIVIGARLFGEVIELTVTDEGIGIPSAALERIFDRFYQVDASSTRRFGGTGLGLALAREIVTLHGGDIHVTSDQHTGSTFTVRLPLATAEAAATPARERGVVLVGAPHGALRALEQLDNVDLVWAESPAEVLRRARRHRPDLVVVALGAGETGALVDQLRQDADVGESPIVAVAAVSTGGLSHADLVVPPGEDARLKTGIERLLSAGPRTNYPLKVVIVDDEAEIVDFTRFVLEREGYQVAALQSGEAALEAIGDDCSLVLLDVALEGMDGIELCRRLRAAQATRSVPVVMVSGMGGDDVRRGAFGAGADGYLLKPFGVEELLRQVRIHVRTAQRARESTT